MSEVKTTASPLNGRLKVPSSKSAAHRAVISAALSNGKSVLSGIDLSNDINATVDGMRSLGAEIEFSGNDIIINGANTLKTPRAEINCRESGSTARFLIPIAAAGGVNAEFTGTGRLPERPLFDLTKVLRKRGAVCGDFLPLNISGKLFPGIYEIPGNVSSQYITGLLFALPLLNGNSEIILTSPLQSEGYVNLTIKILKDFGVSIIKSKNGYVIPGNQKYISRNYPVEADWSQAAFFAAAGAIGGDIELSGLTPTSEQGDKEIFNLIKRFGAKIYFEENKLIIQKNKLHGIEINASQIPDLVPILAVTAAFAEGETVIYNAERLRIKESDRLKAISEGLKALGADVTEKADGLVINGGKTLHAGIVNGYNDHRIVMAFSVAAAFINGETTITNAESVNKSYPDFFNDFKKLGGKANVINMG